MAGKPKQMHIIKQVLQLHKEGKTNRFITRVTDISRNTVKAYLRKLAAMQMDIDHLLALEDPELEKQFHAGNPAYKEERYKQLKSRLDYYASELSRVGVTRQLLWEEYKEDYPDGYSRSQFYYHLSQYIKASKPSMVLHHQAGEKLFVDFAGKKLSYIDPVTGELIECPVFVACLPYSDYAFAIAVCNQSVEEFIYALTQCLQFIGGVPQVLVPDNLKSAVTKADRYEPDIQQTMADFAHHYGFTVIPTRVAKPKDKALVENQVKLVYSRVYAKLRNRQFFSLPDLNKAVQQKIIAHNQTRMQNKPYSREEKFIADELQLLRSLPVSTFEIKYYKTYKVQQNNHILLGEDKHYYSVPYMYIGQQAKVIYTRSIVRIYVQGECVAVHPRNPTQAAYSTNKDHLCSTHRHYLNRSPGYYKRRAKQCSEELQSFIHLLFEQNRPPEQLYKTCDGLLSLYRKTNKDKFNKACAIAIAHEKYSYRFILKLINNKMLDESEDAYAKNLPQHDNIRGQAYYS